MEEKVGILVDFFYVLGVILYDYSWEVYKIFILNFNYLFRLFLFLILILVSLGDFFNLFF